SVGKVPLHLVRLLLRAEPSDCSEAALQCRALTQAGAALEPDEVLVVDAGFGVAALLTRGVPRFVARVARNFTARRNSLPAYKGRGRCPAYGERVRPLPRTRKGKTMAATPRMPLPSGWSRGGRSRPRSGRTSCSRPRSQEPRRF